MIVVTVLGVPFVPERDSLQELFFQEDDENKTEKERTSIGSARQLKSDVSVVRNVKLC